MRKNKGTALLTALLIMGLLLTVSLLISSLILRENRVVKDLLSSGKAYYAAESGVELSLFGLYHQLPGWEPISEGYKVTELDDDTAIEYRMDNRCKTFPCFDDKLQFSDSNDLDVDLAKTFYYELDLNDTLSIPLFVVRDDGAEAIDVKDFAVEFFSPLNVKEHLDVELNPEKINGWDILRWKMIGLEKGSEATETISDFTAISNGTNAIGPSWFGTATCNNFVDRLVPGINCQPYAVHEINRIVSDDGAVDFTGLCSNTEAREFYNYSGGADDREVREGDIADCYSLKTFLNEHHLSYLTLTNLFNPAVLKAALPPDQKEFLSKLYVRVEFSGDDKTVAGFAQIRSNGYSGGTRQSLEVFVGRDSFMPVFNFSLYSTYQ